ncbi:MAG: OmpA family protein [Bacteroidota bacterium]
MTRLIKKLKLTVFTYLILISLGMTGWVNTHAQSSQSPNMAELSVTFMDYRALQGENIFQYKMFDPGITMAGHRYLNRALNLSIATTFVPEVDWVTDEGQYRATSLFDVGAMLQFKTNGTLFEEDALVAPYLGTGFGVNSASNNVRMYIPATLGMKLQVSQNFSVHFAATYKQRLSQQQAQHMAYTAGFVFAMSKKAPKKPIEDDDPIIDDRPPVANANDRDQDGVPDIDDLCPDVKGKIMYLGCPEGTPKPGEEEEDEGIAVIEDVEENNDYTSRPSNNNDIIINDRPNNPPKSKAPPRPISERDKEFLSYAMSQIFFESGSDKIKSESYPILDKVGNIMDKYPAYSLEVMGHTDNRGNAQNNIILSVMRAYRVKYYLVNQRGISMSRITSDGYASSGSNSNQTADERAKNRRVDLKMKPSSEIQKNMFRGDDAEMMEKIRLEEENRN